MSEDFNKKVQNSFGSMYMDSHEGSSDPSRLSFALNAVRQNRTIRDYGYSNELGTDVCTNLPSGYKLRGYVHIAERNEFIVFLFNGTNSEIGGVNIDKCEYHTYLNDSEVPCNLNFGFEEWITIEPKRIQPCNEIVLYWSNNRTYRYYNIDNPQKHLIEGCDDFRLFKCNCGPKVETRVIQHGGFGVLNGVYQIAVQLTDEDNNETNFFLVNNKVKISGANNKAGEVSTQFIQARLDGLSKNYHHVNVAIIKTIGSKTTAHIIARQKPYVSSGLIIEYRGLTDELEDIDLRLILKKDDYYISGKGLFQKDNRLILYDVDNHWNLDYQHLALQAKVGWAAYRVRSEEASKYPSLLGSENYIFGIRWNYCDGTSSPVFPFVNHNKGSAGASCDGCDNYDEVDNSTIDWTHSEYQDVFSEANKYKKKYKNFEPKTDPYVTVDEWAKENKKDAQKTIDDIVKAAEENLEDGDDLSEKIEGSSCCDADTINYSPSEGEDPCKNKVCPPGCECRDGGCYKYIEIPRPKSPTLENRDGLPPVDPDWDYPKQPTDETENHGGEGGVADYVKSYAWVVCDSLPRADSPEGMNNSLAATSCNTTGPCPGCKHCHPEAFPDTPAPSSGGGDTGGDNGDGALELRLTGGGTFETPPDDGHSSRGLCNGGAPGTGCGKGTSMDVEGPKSPQTFGGSLEIRSSCEGTPCDETPCPQGCDCKQEKGALDCGSVNCKSYNCPEGCECVKIRLPVPLYKCIPKKTRKLCVSNGEPEEGTGGDGGTIEGETGDTTVFDDVLYAEDGCTILGYKPVKVMEGLFGYGQSTETYPETKDCEDKEYLYREYAGKPITLFKVPSRLKVPHFISYQTGVKSIAEPGNDELQRSYVQVIGLNIKDIKPPTRTPKPLCGNTPFTIMTIKRNPGNKTILDTGYALGTFEGDVNGEKFMFAKNGTNSLELFDRYIKSNDRSNNPSSLKFEDHAGYISDVAGYTFHSPGTTFRKPFIKGSKFKALLEVHGAGYRHGLYARGEEPGTPGLVKMGGLKSILTGGTNLNIPRMGNKGARTVINLNKPQAVQGAEGGWLTTCIKDITYVDADTVTKKTKDFTYPFHNRYSESCVYMEIDQYIPLAHSIDDKLLDKQYNGKQGENIRANNTCDGSFFGDVKFHNAPVYNASSIYGAIYQKNSKQYGRLEKAHWITTDINGTWDNYLFGGVTGITGDVYISPYTFTKSKYVSDRVGRDVLVNDPITFEEASNSAQNAPDTGSGKNGAKAKKGAKGLKKLALNMSGTMLSWSMGLCGNVPISGLSISIDPRNKAGLRYWNPWTKNDPLYQQYSDIRYGGWWDGESSFLGYIPTTKEFRRCYYPAVQKTEIITWVESEIVCPLRETGEEIDKEINYFETKSYSLDSSFSNNIGWKGKYMNMFYAELEEVSLYKKIFMTFIMLLFRVIWPLYIIVQLGKYIQAGGGIAGALLSLIIQIVILLIVVIIVIMLFIILKTFASEYLLSFLGLKQCYNDFQGGPGDGLIRDFHDNYCEYNWDYAGQNDLNDGYGMKINYNVCPCVAEPSNKIIYSNPQMIDAPNDAWRNFKVNNNLTLSLRYGKVTNMFVVNSKLFAHTTDNIWDLRNGDTALETSEETIILGKGDYINQAYPLWDGIQEGHAGLRYKNGSINTSLGYLFIDDESGQIFIFNGQLQEITIKGVSQFLRENSKFKLLESVPEFTNVDQKSDSGIGYAIGYDHKYKRILITKRDFIPNSGTSYSDGQFSCDGNFCQIGDSSAFGDASWTLSFDLETQSWVSFHSYTPHLYMFDRFRIFSEYEEKLWEYHKGNKFQTFFGKYYPHVIEFHTTPDGFYGYNHKYIEINAESRAYNHNPNVPVRDLNIFFNKGFFYNTQQSTGVLHFRHNTNESNLYSPMKEYNESIVISRQGKNWRLSDMKDYTVDPLQPIYSLDKHYMRVSNQDNIQVDSKHMFLYDRFITNQFILDDRDDIEIISKGALTQFIYPPE